MTRFMIRASTCGMYGGGDNDQTGPHEDVDTLIVTEDYSPPPENSIYINSIIEWQWLLDALYAGSGNPGTEGDGGSSFENEPDNNECNRDAAADIIADEINDQSDAHTTEYGSVLYLDSSGAPQATSLSRGTGDSFAVELPNGVSADQVIGIVHNHPVEPLIDQDLNTPGVQDPIGNAVNSGNRYPSQDDWQQLASLVAAGANPDILSTYILGPDGILREFDYSDRNVYDLPPSQLVENPPPLPTPVDGSDCSSDP